MPFSGTTFTKLYNWLADLIHNEKIFNSRLDDEFGGIATGLTTLFANIAWTNNRLAKTANYTVTNADRAKTLALGGNAFYTVTFNAASGYDANFAIVVTNTDTARGKAIACDGLTSFILWMGQTVIIFNDNNAWRVHPPGARCKVVSSLTFYVDPTNGTDTTAATDGLATGTAAFATLAKALSVTKHQFDYGGLGPTIQLAAATHQVSSFLEAYAWTGGVALTITGATGTNDPSSYIINCAGGDTALSFREPQTVVIINGVTFTTSGAGAQAISVTQGVVIDINNCKFTTFTSGNHISASEGSMINIYHPIISGSAGQFLAIDGGCYVIFVDVMTVSAGLAFSNFIVINNLSYATTLGFSVSGGAGCTGTRYISVRSSLHPSLQGTVLPGNVAGVSYDGGDDGTNGSPFYNFNQDPDTGIYRIGADNPAVAAGGTKCADFKASGTAILGTNTNDSATAGWVGDYVSNSLASGSATGLTTGVAKTITSISLPAGDWDVQGVVHFVPATTTTVTQFAASISQTNNTFDATIFNYTSLGVAYTSASGAECAVNSPIVRVSLASTTTIYLVAQAAFGTSTCTGFGSIRARRPR